MYECAKKIMENIPNDDIGISFLELRDKVGSRSWQLKGVAER